MPFNFNSMPSQLREAVLEKVDIWERLQMLKMNRELRQFILEHGPFPRVLKSVEVISSTAKIEDGRLVATDLSVKIRAWPTVEFLFDTEIYEGNQTKYQLHIQPGHWRIFTWIRSCKCIKIMLGGLNCLNRYATRFKQNFELIDFFRNLKTHGLLEFNAQSVILMQGLFDVYRPTVGKALYINSWFWGDSMHFRNYKMSLLSFIEDFFADSFTSRPTNPNSNMLGVINLKKTDTICLARVPNRGVFQDLISDALSPPGYGHVTEIWSFKPNRTISSSSDHQSWRSVKSLTYGELDEKDLLDEDLEERYDYKFDLQTFQKIHLTTGLSTFQIKYRPKSCSTITQ